LIERRVFAPNLKHAFHSLPIKRQCSIPNSFHCLHPSQPNPGLPRASPATRLRPLRGRQSSAFFPRPRPSGPMDYYRLHRTGKKYPRAFFAAQWDAYELLRTREAELDRDEEREEDTDAPWCRIDEVRAVTFPTDLKSGILNGLRTLLCAEGLPREVRESLLRNTRVSIIRQEWTLGQLSNLYVVTRMWSPFAWKSPRSFGRSHRNTINYSTFRQGR